MASKKLMVIALALSALCAGNAKAGINPTVKNVIKDFSTGFAIGATHGLANRAAERYLLPKDITVTGPLLHYQVYGATTAAAGKILEIYNEESGPGIRSYPEVQALTCGLALGQCLAESITIEQNQNQAMSEVKFNPRLNFSMFFAAATAAAGIYNRIIE